MRDLPMGVERQLEFDSPKGKITILGVVHHEPYPPSVADYIYNQGISPDAFCLEAPKGILDVADHNIAQEYDDKYGVNRIIAIDQRPSNYDGGSEYMDEVHDQGYVKDLNMAPSDDREEVIESEMGETAKESPEWAEYNREREQMMAGEILTQQKLGHNTLVVIVGAVHARELKDSLHTLVYKYDYFL